MVKTGKPDTRQDVSAHIPGNRQGNALGAYDGMAGHEPDGRSNARRSTGVNPKHAEPIDPRMPNLSPG
jgi:hypothetical protein